jgi:predicted dienelactone hydrolase
MLTSMNFVGALKTQVHDPLLGLDFPLLVLYPTAAAASVVNFGPYPLAVAMNAKISPGAFPLVMISHGSGGSNMVYRTLAHHLARQGLVVALPEHPFNHRLDNQWEGRKENMENRPRHISLAIDALAGDERLAGSLSTERVGIIGHSVGAHTALSLAGAVSAPETGWQTEGDQRITALVLLAPGRTLDAFGQAGSLEQVKAPVLMYSAEGEDRRPYEQLDLARAGYAQPRQFEHRLVANAGHYSFLSPFPEALRHRVGPAASDPEGFDREAFHRKLNQEVEYFMRRTLGE